jgi:hypothetical protein
MENDASHNSSIVACVFFAAGRFLPSRCLATINEHTYRHADGWEGFMKYTVQKGSGAMINVPSFIKIDSAIQKLIERDPDTS